MGLQVPEATLATASYDGPGFSWGTFGWRCLIEGECSS